MTEQERIDYIFSLIGQSVQAQPEPVLKPELRCLDSQLASAQRRIKRLQTKGAKPELLQKWSAKVSDIQSRMDSYYPMHGPFWGSDRKHLSCF